MASSIPGNDMHQFDWKTSLYQDHPPFIQPSEDKLLESTLSADDNGKRQEFEMDARLRELSVKKSLKLETEKSKGDARTSLFHHLHDKGIIDEKGYLQTTSLSKTTDNATDVASKCIDVLGSCSDVNVKIEGSFIPNKLESDSKYIYEVMKTLLADRCSDFNPSEASGNQPKLE